MRVVLVLWRYQIALLNQFSEKLLVFLVEHIAVVLFEHVFVFSSTNFRFIHSLAKISKLHTVTRRLGKVVFAS